MQGAALSTLQVREPTLQDATAVVALIRQCELAEFGDATYTDNALAGAWKAIDRHADAWLLCATNSSPLGYAHVRTMAPGEAAAALIVQPTRLSPEIAAHLLDRVQRRCAQLAAAQPNAAITLRIRVACANTTMQELLQRDNFRPSGQSWRMLENLDVPPPALSPLLPSITVRAVRAEYDERHLFATLRAALVGHGGGLPANFDEWMQIRRCEGYDPALWHFAVDRGAVVGAIIGVSYPAMGWIAHLGVDSASRRQGVGAALLGELRRAFRQCGHRKFGLTVDAEKSPAATRFYHRMGMSVSRRYCEFRKDIVAVGSRSPPDH